MRGPGLARIGALWVKLTLVNGVQVCMHMLAQLDCRTFAIAIQQITQKYANTHTHTHSEPVFAERALRNRFTRNMSPANIPTHPVLAHFSCSLSSRLPSRSRYPQLPHKGAYKLLCVLSVCVYVLSRTRNEPHRIAPHSRTPNKPTCHAAIRHQKQQQQQHSD